MNPIDEPSTVDEAAAPVPTRRQKMTAFLLAGAAFLLFYVLSAGPMVAMHKSIKFKPFQTGLEYFYAPLVLVMKLKLGPVSAFLKWYFELFK